MAKPCYSVEGTTTKKNSKIECVVGSVVATIKKVYEVTADGITSLLWGGGIETLFKGVMYSYDGSSLRLVKRSGATIGSVEDLKKEGYHFTVSEDGRYLLTASRLSGYIHSFKYNEATGAYETYNTTTLQPLNTSVMSSYWSNASRNDICFKVNKDGSYFAVAAYGRTKNNTEGTCSLHLVVYKNNGSSFVYHKTVSITGAKSLYNYNQTLISYGAIDDDMSVFACTYSWNTPSLNKNCGVKIFKRTSDDFNFTEIHSNETSVYGDLWVSGMDNVFVSRDGTHVCIPDMTYRSSGYYKHLIMYINGTTATQILSKGHSYLMYYGNMVKSLDGKNLYFFYDSTSSSNARYIHAYSISGATITYLGETLIEKPSSYDSEPDSGYMDELEGGAYALIDTFSGVYFCSVSKATSGAISSFSNLKYITSAGDDAVFIGREF